MSEAATTTAVAENTSQGATSQAATSAQTTDTSAASTQTAQQQQATDGQTQQTAIDAGKTEGDTGAQAKAGAPEKYEFKAPEGQHFDEGVIGAYSEVAKELNLPQDAAQKVIDKLAPALQAKQAKVMEDAKKAWGDASRADKEFGGDKLQESLTAGEKALDQFGSPGLRALLTESGLAHHPEMVRLLARVGKATSEDNVVAGGANAAGQQSLAQRMYPGMNP